MQIYFNTALASAKVRNIVEMGKCISKIIEK
jgi:hypothetical protein